jgi:hypothetical protein
MASVSRQIGWSQESNLLYQILKQLIRLTSVIFKLNPKYKVFTALLTQSGTNSSENTSDSLFRGITYLIDANDGFDFTPYGAPNNNVGTYFICNQDNDDTRTVSFILSYDAGAPVAIVLENTIGNIWFEYSNLGTFLVSSNGLFTNNKSTIIVGNVTWNGGSGIIKAGPEDESTAIIVTALADGTPENTGLENTLIEIRVYN